MNHVIIIAAISRNGVIGDGDSLPWSLPAEYKHFLNKVAGQVVIMGRRSWEIFGKDLSTTRNIVLTHGEPVDGAITAESLEQALQLAELEERSIFIAGGATVYREALAKGYVDQMYLSMIDGNYEGDARFPPYARRHWQTREETEHPGWTFLHLQKQ